MPAPSQLSLKSRFIVFAAASAAISVSGSIFVTVNNPRLQGSLPARFSLVVFAALAAGVAAWLWINRDLRRLKDIARSFEEAADRAGATALNVATASRSLSDSASSQASFLTQTAASAEEMSAMVGRNSESAKATAQSSAKSQDEAQRGKAVVDEMIAAMSQINASNQAILDQVNASNAQFAEIVTVIQEIGSKTKVINDIVFQTKLLSFNASVEAARAGEHGKGFAVVAEEVGNLAQMSGNAAKEISDMLQSSTDKVSGIVDSTREKVGRLIAEGKEKVNTGTEVARQCGVTLESIVRNISSVSQMASDISTASQEQATGVAEINRAMAQLDQVAQTNTSTTGEITRVADDLRGLSRAIQVAVSSLHSAVGSDSRAIPDADTRAPEATSPMAIVPAPTRPQTAPSPPSKAPAKVIPLKQRDAQADSVSVAGKSGKAGGREAVPKANDPRFLDV